MNERARYTTKSTSQHTMEVLDAVVLRETDTTRLVFKPTIVDNQHDEEASVNGTLTFQRKGPKNQWEDFTEQHLSSLKKFEGFSLSFHAAELRNFYLRLEHFYTIHRKHGVLPGIKRFVRSDESLALVAELSNEELRQLTEQQSPAAARALRRLISWYSSLPDPTALVDSLIELGPIAVDSLATLLGVAALRASLRLWADNRMNASEDFWHKELLTRRYLLERLFPFPVLMIRDKAFLGGKGLDNTGGKLVDFLCQNTLTKNVAFVEIKTPVTALLGDEYRAGAFAPSPELAGALTQVLTYRKTLQNSLHEKAYLSKIDIDSADSPCFVLIGDTRQLDTDAKRRSFELFRRNIHGVEIVTYDELFVRVSHLIDAIDGAKATGTANGT